jgi:hypothetical protein
MDSATWTTDPKFEIVDKYSDPLVVGGSALETTTCSDADTNWHQDKITYRNTTANPMQVYIRATAQDASKIMYERMDRVVITAIGRD